MIIIVLTVAWDRFSIKGIDSVSCLLIFPRMIMVGAVKWVDEVISDAPYAITEDFMRKLFDEYNIDYIIHGDDPCLLPDGTDAYALAKKVGRYKQIKRTEGVSSTDIVGMFVLLILLQWKPPLSRRSWALVCVGMASLMFMGLLGSILLFPCYLY